MRNQKDLNDEEILGVDLSHAKHKSGLAILNLRDRTCYTQHITTLEEILLKIRERMPSLLLIDAPLSLPNKGEAWRGCEEKLLELGAHPLPFTFPSMRQLAKRGQTLEKQAETLIPYVFETFPAGSFKVLGFEAKPKTKKERDKAVQRLSKLYKVKLNTENPTKDELDAFMCCLAGFSWVLGCCTEVSAKNCRIILAGKPDGDWSPSLF